MRKIERPTEYDQGIADRLCDKISMGLTFQEILNEPSMPDKRTINRWRSENDIFFRQYMGAFQDQGQLLIEEVKRHMKELESGALDPQRANILISSKIKLAERLYPELYGGKALIDMRVKPAESAESAINEDDIAILRRCGIAV